MIMACVYCSLYCIIPGILRPKSATDSTFRVPTALCISNKMLTVQRLPFYEILLYIFAAVFSISRYRFWLPIVDFC
jgi:hypothetical protein